jgi:hypothetical protein
MPPPLKLNVPCTAQHIETVQGRSLKLSGLRASGYSDFNLYHTGVGIFNTMVRTVGLAAVY